MNDLQSANERAIMNDKISELQRKLKSANKRAAIYRQKLEQIKELRKQGKVAILSDESHSNQILQNLKAKIEELTEENTSLNKKLENIETINNDHDKTDEMEQVITKLEAKVKVSQQNYDSMVNDYNKVISEKEELEKQIESFKDEESQRRGSISAIKSLLMESNEDCKRLEQELSQKEEKLEQIQIEIEMVQQSNVGEITSLKDQIQTLQTSNTSLTQQIQVMQSKLEQKETNYENEIDSNSKKVRELSIMNQVLSRKFEEIDQRLKKQQMKSKQEQEVAEIELNSLRRKSTTLKNEIEEITQESKDKIVKLKEEHHQIIDNLESKCKDLQKQNTELNASFEEYKLDRTRKRLSSEIQLENKIDSLMNENENLKIKHNKDISHLKTQNESLQTDVDKYKETELSLTRLKQENGKLKEQLHDHLTNCMSDKEGFQKQIDQLLKEKTELNQVVNAERERLEAEIKEIQMKHQESLTIAQEQNMSKYAELNGKINASQQQLEAQKQQYLQQETETLNDDKIKVINAENEELKCRLLAVRSQLMSTAIQIDRKDSDIKKMQNQINQLQELKSDNVLEEYRNKITALSVKNEGLDDELNKLRIDYNDLESELSQLQQVKSKQKQQLKKLKQRREKEMDEFQHKVRDLTQRLSMAEDVVVVDSKPRKLSAHDNARMSILKSQFQNLRMDHTKYVEFVQDLSDIVDNTDKQDLNGLLVICQQRLAMESHGEYQKLYEIADKSCNHLLGFISHKSLDINGIINNLEKVVLKYDGSINKQGLNMIEMKIPISLITHVTLQLMTTTNNSFEVKENVSIKLFHKSTWTHSQNSDFHDWIEYGSDKERRLTKITNKSERKLRLFPFFADNIKIEIICPNRIETETNTESIKFSINILGNNVIFE